MRLNFKNKKSTNKNPIIEDMKMVFWGQSLCQITLVVSLIIAIYTLLGVAFR